MILDNFDISNPLPTITFFSRRISVENVPTLTVGSFFRRVRSLFFVHLFNNLNYGGSKDSNLRYIFSNIPNLREGVHRI